MAVPYGDASTRTVGSATFNTLVAGGAAKMSSWFNPMDIASVTQIVTKKSLSEGMLAVVSLKLNWWSGNHHVGQGIRESVSQECWSFLASATTPLDQNSLLYSPIYLPVCLSIFLFIYLSIYLSIYLFFFLSIYLPIYTYLYGCIYIYEIIKSMFCISIYVYPNYKVDLTFWGPRN